MANSSEKITSSPAPHVTNQSSATIVTSSENLVVLCTKIPFIRPHKVWIAVLFLAALGTVGELFHLTYVGLQPERATIVPAEQVDGSSASNTPIENEDKTAASAKHDGSSAPDTALERADNDTNNDANASSETTLKRVADKSSWSLQSLEGIAKIYPGGHIVAPGGEWIEVTEPNGHITYIVRNDLGSSRSPIAVLIVSCTISGPILGLIDPVDSPGSSVEVSVLYEGQTEKDVWVVGPNYMLFPSNPKRTTYKALKGKMLSVVSVGTWAAMYHTEGLQYADVEKTCTDSH